MKSLKNLEEELKGMLDPNFSLKKMLLDVVQEIKDIALGTKGDKGDTPVKGKDYFTDEEIDSIIDFLRSKVKDGYTPVKGIDYFDGTPGRDGYTPIKGKDYYTEAEQSKVISDVLKQIKVKDGISPKVEDIVKKVTEVINNDPKQKFVTVQQLTSFLERGGFRGGAGSGGSGGSGITSINSDTTAAQLLVVGTAGTDFAILDNGTGTHTFNLPTASASNRGALSSADWTTFNNKGSGTVTSVSGTPNRISSTGGATPVIDIDAAYVGQTSITTLGTIGTGTWSATIISLAKGGTGVALSDPGFNAVQVWDDTTSAIRLAAISGLSYDSGTNTLTASGSGVSFGTVGQLPFTNAGATDFDYSAQLSFNGARLLLSGDGTGQVGALHINEGDSVNQYIVLQENAGSPGSAYLTFAGSSPGAMAMGALFTAGVPTSYVFTDTGGTPLLSIDEATGVVNIASLTASQIVITDGSKNLISADTTTYPSLTELSYVKGVTLAIQTQLNGKQATGNYITALTGDVTASGPGSVAATIKNDVALGGNPTTSTQSAGDNTTRIATTAFVTTAVANGTIGLLDYRGSYDASTNLFPATGGSGIAGAILQGDFWICSVGGTLGGVAVTPGDLIIAIVDTPGQTASNWDLIEHNLGTYVTSVSGTTDRITSSGGLTPVIDIAATYVGQTSITTLGTITTGVWNGTAITNANLANSSLTIGSTSIALGATSATLAGLTSVTTGSLLATSNDSGAIGASGTAFSDLFLASGGVINFNAGNVTLTHSSGILTQNAGEFRITSANVGTNADSVPTLSSTSTETNKTFTSPVINTSTLGGHQTMNENAAFLADPVLSADGTYNGWIRAGTAGATLAFGDLCYLDPTDSRWELVDANSASGADGDARGTLGICVLAAASDGSATIMLRWGWVRADAAFPAMTINAPMYVSETAGDITGTVPTTSGVVERVIGVAETADELFFNPSTTWIIRV